MSARSVVVIPGDGIGPEITRATVGALERLDCGLEFVYAQAGVAAQKECNELLPDATLELISKHGVVLKGPLMTPVGGGFRSLNVTLRNHFDMYANVRPALSFPGTLSRYDDVDIITVRENTEGAYLALDSFVSEDDERAESKMVNTRHASRRIAHHAFDLARKQGRKKVTAVHKANILKAVSGQFLDVVGKIANEYEDIEYEEMIVDACAMKLVMDPSRFDVLVTTNLFGDIISDLCAGLVGGLGLAPGANIGDDASMFEAVHGSAPDIAGQGIANPCALMLAAAMMLDHIELHDCAEKLRHAIRETIVAGDRLTPDLGGSGSTQSIAEAVYSRL
jgi:isocitrate dehydrogenase (NAD+)